MGTHSHRNVPFMNECYNRIHEANKTSNCILKKKRKEEEEEEFAFFFFFCFLVQTSQQHTTGSARMADKDASGADTDTNHSGAIRVVVRCRPLLVHETVDQSVRSCVSVDATAGRVAVNYHALHSTSNRTGNNRSTSSPSHFNATGSDFDESGNGTKSFHFDAAFAVSASNEQVYNAVVQPLVKQVEEGFDATFFAYGQVGSGKTHSVSGISPLVGRDMLAFVRQWNEREAGSGTAKGGKFMLRAAFFEIYNEALFDLMVPLGSDLDQQTTAMHQQRPSNGHGNNGQGQWAAARKGSRGSMTMKGKSSQSANKTVRFF